MITFKKVKAFLALVVLVFSVWAFIEIDYSKLSWEVNQDSYRVILLSLTAFFNLFVLNIIVARQKKKRIAK